MDWIKLYDENGREIDLPSIGLIGLKLSIPSPSYSRETQTIEGMDGEIVIDQQLNAKTLEAEFWSKSKSYDDSLRSRDALYGLLGNGRPFYVSESRQPGKWFRVRLDGWEPTRINSYFMSFTVPLYCASGKSETIRVEEKTFKTTAFDFKNDGTAAINMRQQADTEIEFRGASQNLRIRNKTTGEEWSYNGTSTAGNTILIKGVRSTKNGVSVFGSTNKKLVGFAPGWNSIEIEGATGDLEVTIRTRFYFL